MKQIKIFLASSEELRIERNEFSDLILELNTIFESWKLQLKLVKWEHLDSSMGILHKQEEYNTELSQCEMCLVLYWTKCGEYTQIELDTAFENLKAGKNPQKLYVFFKDAPEEELSEEMHKFKKNFTNNYGHFYCKFANVDTMRLEFVMQFAIYQSKVFGDKLLQLEDEYVTIGGKRIVNLNKVPFIAYNKEFQAAMERLGKLEEKIEKLRIRQAKYPDDKDFINELQESINELNELKEELAKSREQLFETAQKIAGLSGKHITERMGRAITAFNEGRVAEANVILAEAEHDADDNISQYRFAKAAAVEARNSVVKSIEELKLKAEIVAADMSLAAEDRISQARASYEKAIALAREIEYDPEKYYDLLFSFGYFLTTFALYQDALSIHQEALNLAKKTFGEQSVEYIANFNCIGLIYNSLNNHSEAEANYHKAQKMFDEQFGKENFGSAVTLDNISLSEAEKGNYDEALQYAKEANKILSKQLGVENPHVAVSINNMALAHLKKGEYDKALKLFTHALKIYEKNYGNEHREVATCLNNIANIHFNLGHYDSALDLYNRAYEIDFKLFGKEHPNVVLCLHNIGKTHLALENYGRALTYIKQALEIGTKIFGENHSHVATCLNGMGLVYAHLKDFDNAFSCHKQALESFIKLYGSEHKDVAESLNNLG
ncbi:MAG: tetratricopeptide repeat protein, partial [Candidatus Cryptobacteroides sp.]